MKMRLITFNLRISCLFERLYQTSNTVSVLPDIETLLQISFFLFSAQTSRSAYRMKHYICCLIHKLFFWVQSEVKFSKITTSPTLALLTAKESKLEYHTKGANITKLNLTIEGLFLDTGFIANLFRRNKIISFKY